MNGALTNEDLTEEVADPIDAEREAMLAMQEAWPAIFEQLPCSDQDYACWICPAGRVVHCVVNNCDKEIRDRAKGLVE